MDYSSYQDFPKYWKNHVIYKSCYINHVCISFNINQLILIINRNNFAFPALISNCWATWRMPSMPTYVTVNAYNIVFFASAVSLAAASVVDFIHKLQSI